MHCTISIRLPFSQRRWRALPDLSNDSSTQAQRNLTESIFTRNQSKPNNESITKGPLAKGSLLRRNRKRERGTMVESKDLVQLGFRDSRIVSYFSLSFLGSITEHRSFNLLNLSIAMTLDSTQKMVIQRTIKTYLASDFVFRAGEESLGFSSVIFSISSGLLFFSSESLRIWSDCTGHSLSESTKSRVNSSSNLERLLPSGRREGEREGREGRVVNTDRWVEFLLTKGKSKGKPGHAPWMVLTLL